MNRPMISVTLERGVLEVDLRWGQSHVHATIRRADLARARAAIGKILAWLGTAVVVGSCTLPAKTDATVVQAAKHVSAVTKIATTP